MNAVVLAPEDTTLAEQCAVVLRTAGIEVAVVAVPPLYLTVHVQTWEDAQSVHAILSLRDDLRYWRFRAFGLTDADRNYVLMFFIVKEAR